MATPPTTPAPSPATVPEQTAEALTPEAVQTKIAELDQKIKDSRASENDQTARQLGVDLALLQKRTTLLQGLRESYGWLAENLGREAELQEEKTALLKNLAAQKEGEVTAPPPYSLSFYENLLSQMQFYDQREEAYPLSNSLLQEYLTVYAKEQEEAGKKERLLRDQLAAATLPEATRKLRFELEIAFLEKALAKTRYLSAKTYGGIFQLLRDMAASQTGLYRQQAAWVQKHLDAEDIDRDKHVLLLEQDQAKLEARRTELRHAMQARLQMWAKADKAAARAGAPLPAEISQERVLWQHTYQSILDALVQHLSILRSKEYLWKNRLLLLKGGASQKQLLQWQEDVKQKKEKGKRYFTYLGEQNVFLQAQLAALEKRLTNPDLDPRLKEVLTDHQAAYSLAIRELNSRVQTSTDLNQLARHFSLEINAQMTQSPWSAFLARLQVSLQRFLDFEIWVIEGQAVTIKKFLQALAFLVVGLLLAKVALHYLIYPVLEKTVWRQTKAEILQKAVTYLAYTLVFLITLGKLHIPLQSFATLGGGIAIGLGFATQTIIKNFVSGLIILGEKPFGLGDLVEVGGILGNVHNIGSRSTLLRTGENKDLLVPNSFFLENTITNWTRRDRRVRAQVTVGVAYGSPVAQVKELLLQAAAATEQILKSPQPFVLFNDFGDNSLVFDVYFWIEIAGVLGRLRVQSTMRFKIDELFRAAGLVIAYPQRDIHLDTPLEIHLVNKET